MSISSRHHSASSSPLLPWLKHHHYPLGDHFRHTRPYNQARPVEPIQSLTDRWPFHTPYCRKFSFQISFEYHIIYHDIIWYHNIMVDINSCVDHSIPRISTGWINGLKNDDQWWWMDIGGDWVIQQRWIVGCVYSIIFNILWTVHVNSCGKSWTTRTGWEKDGTTWAWDRSFGSFVWDTNDDQWILWHVTLRVNIQNNYGTTQWTIRKLTISMAMFNNKLLT